MKRSTSVQTALVTLALLTGGLHATAAQVSLQWTPPTENIDGSAVGSLAGYRLYRGTVSGHYTEVVDVGQTPQITLTDLSETTTTYFSVSTYSGEGVESTLSEEVAWNPPPPSAVEPIYPSGGETVDTRTPTLRWTPTGDTETWYRLVVRLDQVTYLDQWIQGVEYDLSDELGPGSYHWQVHPWSPQGFGPSSAIASFEVQAEIPGLPALLEPYDQQVGSTLVYRWQVDPTATWYQFVTARGETEFHREWYHISELVVVDGVAEITVAEHQWGSYHWYIRGWGPEGMGPWAGATFEIDAILPDTPTLHAPLGSQAETDITFRWTHDSKATWYHVRAYRDGAKEHAQWYRASDIASGDFAEITLHDNRWGAYQWDVRGWAPDGMGQWSQAGQFTVGQIVPLHGTPHALSWTDSSTAAAEWYHFILYEIGDDDAVISRDWWVPRDATSDHGSSIRSVGLSPALPQGSYEWTIHGWSSAQGAGPWSEPAQLISSQ